MRFMFRLPYRRAFVVVVHVLLIAGSNYTAFWLRFDGDLPAWAADAFIRMLPWLVLVRGLTFVPFKLYQGLWRYTGIYDLRNIILGVVSSSALFYLGVRIGYGFFGLAGYPRSVMLIDTCLLILLVGGVRLPRRIYRELGRLDRERRVLIYGAGDAGETIVRDMHNNPSYEYEPIGFIDDDPAKLGKRIHGVKVLGGRDGLARIVAEQEPSIVLLAIPHAAPALVRSLVRDLQSFKVPIKTLPSLRDVLDGDVATGHIRNLSIEDLLERAPVGLDPEPVRDLVAGRRVMVTGAGGSIGSELSRQIAALAPEALVLLDRYENGLYGVGRQLARASGAVMAHEVIADVTDGARVRAVLAEYRPDIIFHAAAHKHVPLMEANPCEAVKNNVLGTRLLSEAAEREGVSRFVLISSDKAVNPSSVMGATKRVAELMMQRHAARADCAFVAVRFGNVLGSSGSVVPLFLEQIAAGGPVTVTHPDVERYFMLIPEAVHLVLHAAAIGQPGALYVLEMGEPIRVLDLARNMIRLSGFVPEADIPITFIGLRPGEKLTEDLTGPDESVEASSVEKILRVRTTGAVDGTCFDARVAELERLAAEGDAKAVIGKLAEIAPALGRAAR